MNLPTQETLAPLCLSRMRWLPGEPQRRCCERPSRQAAGHSTDPRNTAAPGKMLSTSITSCSSLSLKNTLSDPLAAVKPWVCCLSLPHVAFLSQVCLLALSKMWPDKAPSSLQMAEAVKIQNRREKLEGEARSRMSFVNNPADHAAMKHRSPQEACLFTV